MNANVRRWTNLLVVAGTAAIAAACGIPSASSPTPIAKSDVPYRLLDPPTTTTTNPGSPIAVGVPEVIFLAGPDGHLVAVTRDVAIPASLSQIMGALLEGPTAAESASGIQSFLSGNNIQVTATQSAGVASVNFSADPIHVVGPDQTLAVAQAVYTVTQQLGINGVTFSIKGKSIEVPTAAGAQVPGPVSRSDYLAQAPLP